MEIIADWPRGMGNDIVGHIPLEDVVLSLNAGCRHQLHAVRCPVRGHLILLVCESKLAGAVDISTAIALCTVVEVMG